MSVLVSAASLIILRTRILPQWLALLGLIAALLALIQFLIPPYGGMLALLWIVVLSALMLSGAVSTGRRRIAARATSWVSPWLAHQRVLP